MKKHPEQVMQEMEESYVGNVRIGGVGHLVNALLNHAHLKDQEAEEVFGCDRTTWFRWKKHKRKIPGKKLAELAFVAGFDHEEVVAYAVLKAMERHLPGVLDTEESHALLKNVRALVESKIE